MNDRTEDFELATTGGGTLADLTRAEVDQQITTAKKFPRSIKRFVDEATAMVTLNESIAGQCIYALPRSGKTIEGPSARFAEIIISAWGNCRAGARIVSEGEEFITAQGVFHDLERNVGIQYEVQRRITDSGGRRYKADMIGVTGNAANSIALRNAALKGVPKAFWEPIYQKARAVVAGDFKTLANRRAAAVQTFAVFGVTEPMLLAKLGRAGIADVSIDDLVTLHGMLNAIKDGDSTPEDLFGDAGAAARQDLSAKPKTAPAQASAAPQDQQRQEPADEPKQDVAVSEGPAAQKQASAQREGDSSTGAKATDGKKKLLRARIESAGLSIEEVCAAVGISDFEALTVDGAQAITDHLNEGSGV